MASYCENAPIQAALFLWATVIELFWLCYHEGRNIISGRLDSEYVFCVVTIWLLAMMTPFWASYYTRSNSFYQGRVIVIIVLKDIMDWLRNPIGSS